MTMERPIFVIGAPRSGTTLLRYMLCSHPRIYIPPESNFIPRFFQDRPRALLKRQEAIHIVSKVFRYRNFLHDWRGRFPDPESFVDALPYLTPATLIDAVFREYASQNGAVRWGDKSPIYTEYVDVLDQIFPSAQFIHIVRDGRDVALSMRDCYHGLRFFYIDLMYAARTWKRRIRKAHADAARLSPDRYFELRYEDLVANPEPLLKQICDYLGEDYVPAMAEPHKEASAHYHSTGIHAATRQPPTTRRAERWRREMSETDQRLFETVAGDLLAELGYPTQKVKGLSLAERTHFVTLNSKFAFVQASGFLLQSIGVFHPSGMLSELWQWRKRTAKRWMLSSPPQRRP